MEAAIITIGVAYCAWHAWCIIREVRAQRRVSGAQRRVSDAQRRAFDAQRRAFGAPVRVFDAPVRVGAVTLADTLEAR